MITENQTTGMSFLRRRGSRVALGAASVAGFTLLGAVPAFAATDADCTAGNTVDAGAGGTAANIQTLLDADTSVICISGTFVLTTPLTFDHTLTMYGLSDGVLDGNAATQILTGSSAPLTVQNLTFQNGSSSYGGAIAAETVTVIDSRFMGNDALLGGAVAADEVDVEGSTFVDNTAFLGGAIFTYGQVEVSTSTFTENSASEYGGAIFTYNFLGVDSSTFEANSAGSVGGALYVEDDILVENSTFVGNMIDAEEGSGEGGAVVASYGTVLQSTFVDNTASLGNAISASNNGLELKGNIFVGESTEEQLASDTPDITDLGGNVFSTAAESALADVQATTLFSRSVETVFAGATLADNGGPTETVALYAGSPAIDQVPAGEPSVTVDQRGVARDAKSDSGAYEFAAAVAPAGPVLAATGSTTDGWIAGAAGILLAAGGLVLAAVRRRRASDV